MRPRPDDNPDRKPRGLRRSSSMAMNERKLPSSVTSLLEATAIPIPRRSWSVRDSRKLPRRFHVEDFSQLLMEGVKLKEDSFLDGTGNSPLDILLSPPEKEPDKLVSSSNCDRETLSSMHSSSSVSTPSSVTDCESPSSLPGPATPLSPRSPVDRKARMLSPTEDCAFDHPLLDASILGFETDTAVEDLQLPDPVNWKPSSSLFRSFPRLKSTFKSNLTASLRVIKSAAQSMSTFATPSVQPDDFLTRSLFAITPELTDDRRPHPMLNTPSPALRRYLNPMSLSPAEMHVYHDYPRDSPTGGRRYSAVCIQLQTYCRAGGKGSFKLTSASGCDRHMSGFDPGAPPITRQREPRENSHFLRMVVLEMNMRRCGKLRDDVPMHAKIWLPPRKADPYRPGGPCANCAENGENATVPARWVGISVECR